MRNVLFGGMLVMLAVAGVAGAGESGSAAADSVQAQVILTVSEGKRLIAKAVSEMPVVKQALQDGMVVIARGTTNTYVAEELTGQKIAHGAYVIGWTGPAKGGQAPEPGERIEDIVLVNGQVQTGMSMDDALNALKAGDVVIKGANALDREHKTAGVLIGGGPNSSAGTTGKVYPVVVSRKAHLVIPIGLEKQVQGDVIDIANKMREPVESLNNIPSMFLVTGHILTEIEALELLTGASVFQAAAGGIAGAEGSSRLICRGTREQVEKALAIAESIQGEPAFLE
ncbi:MAG TPA: hypothetical protein PLB67_13070 [Candidatus Hydrogenedentes bacterium]|jgi:hypothetical protein|nr:hypothetical protein [FCB group bacterium]NLT60332.1 hypothetical protein [Candidatus Hydrogenedentota bacterium]HNV23094.1 hypothetical protein [Candidatus Hydrogenedentota bacterium]HOH35092.1 hypothetical protein [Candidatus Hydrogenedentota bacterium]HPA05366.1 hypothetical protein [Candidatus Hydrogenedentota bacterium]